jgi:hypothetical protein
MSSRHSGDELPRPVKADGERLTASERASYLLVSGDQAVVELRALATARNGMRLDNRSC